MFLAFLGHLLGQLGAAFAGHGHHLGAVFVVGVHAVGQRDVVLAKAPGHLLRPRGALAHQLQHGAGAFKAGLEQLALHQCHPQVAQRVPVGQVPCASHQLQLREVLARQGDDLEGLLGVVHRHHQHAGVLGPGNAQQVQPGGVAIKHAVPKGAGDLENFHAVVQHGGGYALGQHHTRHDLPVAAEAGDDDRGFLWLRDLLLRRCGGLELRVTAQQGAVYQHQQQRADEHGKRHRADEQRGRFGRKHLRPGGGLEDHEGKLAPLRQQQGEHGPLLIRHACHFGQGVDHHRLQGQKTQQDACHEPGRAHEHAKVNAHAHRDEEQAQQQALEGLDVGFQLAAVFAVGQQHPGQKSPERHRQAHHHHQIRNAHHQQQRGGGEDFRRAALGNPAQQGAQQQATAEHDGADHADDLQGLQQHLARRMVVASPRGRAQQGQQRQDGDGRHVLEQQD